MKRYKRDSSLYNNSIGRITEKVIHVKKYLNILKDEMNYLKKRLKTYKGDKLQLFNESFYKYKISFHIVDSLKGENACVEGRMNRGDIKIYLNEDFYFYTAKENLDVFNQFEKELFILLSHELVHRGQYLLRIGDKLNFYNFEGSSIPGDIDLDYMKDPQEIMAYAYMYIESLRYSGYTDIDIMKMLKTGNFARSQSLHISFYINEMKQYNTKAFLKFRKYILQYINDPITYDLKVI